MRIKCSRHTNASTIIRFIAENHAPEIPDFTGGIDQISVRYEEKKSLIYCGIGTAEQCTPAILRSAVAKAAQAIQKLKRTIAACVVPDLPLNAPEIEKAIIEGMLLGSYCFSKYKTGRPVQLSSLELIGGISSPAILRKYRQIGEAVNYARDLVNENASVVTPAQLAREATKLTQGNTLSVTILDHQALRRNKLDLITAVGGGSASSPALIILEYRGGRRRNSTTAIVGKGVTFDSGGQNLKPTGSIETMRHDMAGAAAVLGLFAACRRIKPAVNLVGVIPAVHNAIGSRAFFPGDIYTSYSGTTVEIWSTDAEGRLILADAIAYCRENYHPDRIVDLATLTGGIVTALGDLVAGLFSNNDELALQLFAAGEKTGERLWRLPLYKEYSESLKGDLGDLRNLSKFKKGVASSITGAAFIKEFAGETPWAHLDIAGTAYNEGTARGVVPQFATGFGVRLLLEFLGV
ncbi:MAG: leucyl aminopeptidase family protein [Chitinispirillaceae bacterium]|nr:leucyl aminopeptidase family protein [Chitinispirillaceae bacterium]